MNQVHILVEGYAHPGENGAYHASPTSTLITTRDNKKILVDPGTNAAKLLEALAKLSINESDLTGIFLSHYHPDHFLNIRLFPNTDVYDGGILWQGDRETFYESTIPGTDIEILKTPGHADEDASLLVKTAEGIVCIAPDVFWWEDGNQKTDNINDLLSLVDPFANNPAALLESRKLVISKADIIIPGHGRKFENHFRMS
ncbi:MBL fold metallo-hydrolase [Candidatus Shapirobacteria bacterium]|nr:MBL fold metallo-hydrolase [Candidatus Shapirobacteria bacterium]